jgi:D-beta-D-heptose 7-phosphate kinase/D-beta-D-heptose 1-phosphate adenosyltransferase
MNKIVLATGGYDPLHSGHIAYFRAARALGDHLVVGLNSDAWLDRKKGRAFMPFAERAAIVKELACVDEVISFDDSDNTACAAIDHVLSSMGPHSRLIFANGGDRTNTTTPEYETYGNRKDVHFAFGVGGEDKRNSSSWILNNYYQNQPVTVHRHTVERAWGRYTVLEHEKDSGWAVKHLEFDAGKSLSDQRHFKRSEHWHVVDGVISIVLEDRKSHRSEHLLVPGDSIDIPIGYWHKAKNIGDRPARVIEVWMGKELTEEDIERRD